MAATVEGIGTDGDRWVAIIRAVKPPITPTPLTMIDDTATEAACCGVTACCMPGEHATDPATTIAEAKTAAGCACTD